MCGHVIELWMSGDNWEAQGVATVSIVVGSVIYLCQSCWVLWSPQFINTPHFLYLDWCRVYIEKKITVRMMWLTPAIPYTSMYIYVLSGDLLFAYFKTLWLSCTKQSSNTVHHCHKYSTETCTKEDLSSFQGNKVFWAEVLEQTKQNSFSLCFLPPFPHNPVKNLPA